MATTTTYTQVRKNYYNNNKAEISAKAAEYYESKKEHLKQQQKIRYLRNKALALLEREIERVNAAAETPALTHTEVFSS